MMLAAGAIPPGGRVHTGRADGACDVRGVGDVGGRSAGHVFAPAHPASELDVVGLRRPELEQRNGHALARQTVRGGVHLRNMGERRGLRVVGRHSETHRPGKHEDFIRFGDCTQLRRGDAHGQPLGRREGDDERIFERRPGVEKNRAGPVDRDVLMKVDVDLDARPSGRRLALRTRRDLVRGRDFLDARDASIGRCDCSDTGQVPAVRQRTLHDVPLRRELLAILGRQRTGGPEDGVTPLAARGRLGGKHRRDGEENQQSDVGAAH
jgi:hypothetical protein